MQRNRPEPIAIPDDAARLGPALRFARASGQQFEALNVGGAVQITLYDSIGPDGVDAQAFRQELQRAASRDVVLRLNSPGGSVFDGLAMFSDLVSHPGHVRVEISGVAASAASLLCMAGDQIAMAPRSFLMVHNSHTLAAGDADHLDEVADVLRRIDSSMAQAYAERSGQNVTAIRALMSAETWFNADEALAKGFATEVIDPHADSQASFDLAAVYARVPEELRTFVPSTTDPNKISTRRDYESFLRDAGMSRSRAKAISASFHSQTQRDADEASETAAYIARAAKLISI